MAIDHLVLILIGVVGIIGGLFLLNQAKAYRAKQHPVNKHPNNTKHA